MKNIFRGLVGALVVYEAVTLYNDCKGDTISEIIWSATTKRPLVPFAAGLLCGHFFWQRVDDDDPAAAAARQANQAADLERRRGIRE